MVASATIGSAVVGGIASSSAASKAAKAQTSAAAAANQVQMDMFNKTQENLAPYMKTGGAANDALYRLMGLAPQATGYDNTAYNNALTAYRAGNPTTGGTSSASNPNAATVEGAVTSGKNPTPWKYLMSDGSQVMDGPLFDYLQKNNANQGFSTKDFKAPGDTSTSGGAEPQLSDFPTYAPGSDNPLNSPLLKPITMDQATLEKTPGYQFNLSQGLKSVQNSAAARGLGNSGAALKGAAQYATGLADSTYQNQFNNAVTNQTNQFNRLTNVAQSGQNAAAGLGGIGQQTASNIGGNLVGASNAQGASYMAGANAITNAANSASNGYAANRLNGMYANNSSYNPSDDDLAYADSQGWL